MSNPSQSKPHVVVPAPLSQFRKALAVTAGLLIRALAITLRWRFVDESGIPAGERKQNVIFAIWHNRLALCMIIYTKYVAVKYPGHGLAAIVSASRDGSIVARVLEHFDVVPIRGSSSRRGPQALKELVTAAKKGHDIAITPDGPRGPCYVVQDGVVALAQLTGMPIIPVSYSLSWKIRVKSWDRFQIPLPFATWRVHFGKPIAIPRDSTPEEREALRLELENRLKAMTVD